MARALLGARFAAVTGYLKFASKTGYFLKTTDKGVSYFDIDAIQDYVAQLPQEQPAVVFGFTYILYQNVLKTIEEKGAKINLPKGSKIIHIGGWKKLESEKIDKALLASRRPMSSTSTVSRSRWGLITLTASVAASMLRAM